MRARICSMICSTFTESDRTLKSGMEPQTGSSRRGPPDNPARARRPGPRATLDLGRGGEALDGVVLRVVGFKHRQQLGDRQQVRDALGQIQELEATALAADRRVGPDDLT